MKCQYEGCSKELNYRKKMGMLIYGVAASELREDGTKVWRSELCRQCEQHILDNNAKIRHDHPKMTFKEVT